MSNGTSKTGLIMEHYHHELIDLARIFRGRMTSAETLFWKAVRNRGLGSLKFKRQHRIGRFIVDFYCKELLLVVELEGGVHGIPSRRIEDQLKFEELADRGYEIMRISNEEVIHHLSNVLQRILSLKK